MESGIRQLSGGALEGVMLACRFTGLVSESQESLMQLESPVFVTGMPRSGTTFMQQLLSLHPEITISGQEPQGVCWGEWLQTLLNGVKFTKSSNQVMNDHTQHYACAMDESATTTQFLKFIQAYLVGQVSTRRWGLKSLTNCRLVPDALRFVWPETKWIVCIRDPFRSMESLRNTFDRNCEIPWKQLCNWWSDAVMFAETQVAAYPVYFDRLETRESRQQITHKLFDFIDEKPTNEVWEFVDSWPVVHKVVPDRERDYQLGTAERDFILKSNLEFAALAEKLGYLKREAVEEVL